MLTTVSRRSFGMQANNGIFVAKATRNSDGSIASWSTTAVVTNTYTPGGPKVKFDALPSLAVDTFATLRMPHAVARARAALAQSLAGSDPDLSDVLTYRALDLPEGATLDTATGLFRWTPGPGQAGDFGLTFVVSDGESEASRTITVHAAIVPEPPLVTVELTPSFPVVPGQKVVAHVIARGRADITGLTFRVDGQPVTLDAHWFYP